MLCRREGREAVRNGGLDVAERVEDDRRRVLHMQSRRSVDHVAPRGVVASRSGEMLFRSTRVGDVAATRDERVLAGAADQLRARDVGVHLPDRHIAERRVDVHRGHVDLTASVT